MSKIVGFDSPLTKLKQECEEKLAARDIVIEDLQRVAATAREQAARTRGTNEMLHLLLAQMGDQMNALAEQVNLMQRNIVELRTKLPDITED